MKKLLLIGMLLFCLSAIAQNSVLIEHREFSKIQLDDGTIRSQKTFFRFFDNWTLDICHVKISNCTRYRFVRSYDKYSDEGEELHFADFENVKTGETIQVQSVYGVPYYRTTNNMKESVKFFAPVNVRTAEKP